ncbi:Zinc finger protein-like protein [Emericellopsis cladophorae]|uniref:Zinc finger protein-like protein n=1 Tax=Emericellopsis cladophorae TaxID=2686198 RepID=A0A9P9Y953_9HYPO|nr:Zinc finger protein-like protein [Emericellopsis cladophorae]KAI6785756.1 Zinc finger protein-like protein [Emericellopsis cladophorae]
MKRSREREEVIEHSSDDSADNIDIRHISKISELDPESPGPAHDNTTPIMRCTLPPHKEPMSFRSYGEYESHYNNAHTNRCLECRKNFPSEHLLTVHIEEFHDPLVVVRRDRGEHTYTCFVEGCERKCLTYQKRRMHMIDKHMFPKNYFFAVTKEGIDGRRSLLIEGGHHRRQSSNAAQSKETKRRESLQGLTENKGPADRSAEDPGCPKSGTQQRSLKAGTESRETPDEEMDDLTGAMSSLQFVPSSIRFGRGRAGFARR